MYYGKIWFIASCVALSACVAQGQTNSSKATGLNAKVLNNSLMPSADVNLTEDTVTLPLFTGKLTDGRKVYYILTDVSNRAIASEKGLVYAPALSAAATLGSTRHAQVEADGTFTFDKGTVDFAPKHNLVPGDAPNFFPPQVFEPGSVGDMDYSPLVEVNGVVYNAPILAFATDAANLAFCDGNVNYDLVQDKVVKICPTTGKVTLKITHGFASGKEVIYISTDSNNALPATMEQATYAPAMQDLVGAGADDVLYAFANGATGVNNPERQGFNSALAGEGSPFNILEGLSPSSRGYTPMWDVRVAVWTNDAITANQRKRLTDGDSVDAAATAGQLTNPMGAPVSTLGLLVNCPVIGFVN